MAEIDNTIEKLNIKSTVKSEVKEIYRELAAAESYVHGVEISNIHLHEVGAVDSIVDTIALAVCYDNLCASKQIKKIFVPKIFEGKWNCSLSAWYFTNSCSCCCKHCFSLQFKLKLK